MHEGALSDSFVLSMIPHYSSERRSCFYSIVMTEINAFSVKCDRIVYFSGKLYTLEFSHHPQAPTTVSLSFKSIYGPAGSWQPLHGLSTPFNDRGVSCVTEGAGASMSLYRRSHVTIPARIRPLTKCLQLIQEEAKVQQKKENDSADV